MENLVTTENIQYLQGFYFELLLVMINKSNANRTQNMSGFSNFLITGRRFFANHWGPLLEVSVKY